MVSRSSALSKLMAMRMNPKKHQIQYKAYLHLKDHMSSMKILVYGGNGWIGKQFSEILTRMRIEFVMGVSRADDSDAVSKEINQLKPTHVVSMIGRTHGKIGTKTYSTIDYLEQKGKLVENVSKQNGIKNSKEPNILISDLYFLDASR